MELTQLKYFCEVASTQHITMSAGHLHIAQPALTQTIHRLEAELGVPLFSRRGRNIELTEYGKYLYSQVRPVLDTLSALPEELSVMAGNEARLISINMPAASIIITQAIISYQKFSSDVQFQVHQIEEFGMYDIDISTELKSRHESGKFRKVFTEKIFLAVPKNGKYQHRSSIALDEVRDEKFISLSGSRQYRSICDKICAGAGFVPHIIFESDSPASVRDLISANIGVGFWPEFTWGSLEAGNMILLPVSDSGCSRDIVLSYNPDNFRHKRAFEFYGYLSDFFESLFCCGESV